MATPDCRSERERWWDPMDVDIELQGDPAGNVVNLGRNRFLFGDTEEEQRRMEESFKRAYVIQRRIKDNQLPTMHCSTTDIVAALSGKEGPPLDTLQPPLTLTWDAANAMPLLHISFLLNHFLPRRHISKQYSLWVLHRLQSYLHQEFADTPDIVPELAGSIPEGFAVPPHNPRHQFNQGLNAVPLDQIDVNSSDSDMVLVAVTKVIGAKDDNDVRFTMETENCSPGYCRIVAKEPVTTDPSFLASKPDSNIKYLVGNAILDGILAGLRVAQQRGTVFEADIVRHGPAVTSYPNKPFTSRKLENDFVFAMPCKEWPEEARKWIERPTTSGWPSLELKKKLFSDGCLVVSVPHHSSSWREVEWRISSSRVERALAATMTDIQRQCYILLKILVKGTLEPSKLISSYHLKTLLFWCSERFPQSMWTENDESLGRCFLALLDELQHYLIQHRLPHYIYTNNNVFSHISEYFMPDIIRKVAWVRRNVAQAVFKFDAVHCFSFSPRAFTLESCLKPLVEEASRPYDDINRAYASYAETLKLLAKSVLVNFNADDFIDYIREACQIGQTVFKRDMDFIPLSLGLAHGLKLPALMTTAVIEVILRRFPSTEHAYWLKGNAACLYHLLYHKKEPHGCDPEMCLDRAKELFEEATTSKNTTAATWTDYVNFLYQEGCHGTELEEAVERSVSLAENHQPTNTYEYAETVPDVIGQEIISSGAFTVPSKAYALFLGCKYRIQNKTNCNDYMEKLIDTTNDILDPALKSNCHKLLAYCQMALEDFPAAVMSFQSAIELNEGSPATNEAMLTCTALQLSMTTIEKQPESAPS